MRVTICGVIVFCWVSKVLQVLSAYRGKHFLPVLDKLLLIIDGLVYDHTVLFLLIMILLHRLHECLISLRWLFLLASFRAYSKHLFLLTWVDTLPKQSRAPYENFLRYLSASRPLFQAGVIISMTLFDHTHCQ